MTLHAVMKPFDPEAFGRVQELMVELPNEYTGIFDLTGQIVNQPKSRPKSSGAGIDERDAEARALRSVWTKVGGYLARSLTEHARRIARGATDHGSGPSPAHR